VAERNYIYLSFFWIAFCFSHSLFAALPVKRIISHWTGKYFTWYRILYSFCSLLFLIFLLQYQTGKKETVLFFVIPAVRIASIILILGGSVVMILAAIRYFIPVTGFSIFTKRKAGDILFDGGIHGVVRHPLYAGTLLLIWGLFLFFPFASNLIACVIISIYTFIGIKLEEKKLLLQFGKTYELYRQHVPMMIRPLRFRKFKWQIKVEGKI
jgi:methanethiol S-methyltransferase